MTNSLKQTIYFVGCVFALLACGDTDDPQNEPTVDATVSTTDASQPDMMIVEPATASLISGVTRLAIHEFPMN